MLFGCVVRFRGSDLPGRSPFSGTNQRKEGANMLLFFRSLGPDPHPSLTPPF
jgi:hypothetical protein